MATIKQNLKEIEKKIDSMPLVGSRVQELILLLSNENWQMKELLRIIESDVAITTRCLQVVNSSLFSLPQKINSIQMAITYLGSRTLINIAFEQGLKHIFGRKLKGYEANPGEFWDHSLRTAITARIICEKFSPNLPRDVLYTGGLLHDIGKAIISEFLERYQKDIEMDLTSIENKDFLEVERKYLGIDHTMVGERMAKKWNFPEILVNIITHHHQPDQSQEKFLPAVTIVHLADLIAMMSGSGTGMDSLQYSLSPLVESELQIARENIPEIIYHADMEYLKTIERLRGAA